MDRLESDRIVFLNPRPPKNELDADERRDTQIPLPPIESPQITQIDTDGGLPGAGVAACRRLRGTVGSSRRRADSSPTLSAGPGRCSASAPAPWELALTTLFFQNERRARTPPHPTKKESTGAPLEAGRPAGGHPGREQAFVPGASLLACPRRCRGHRWMVGVHHPVGGGSGKPRRSVSHELVSVRPCFSVSNPFSGERRSLRSSAFICVRFVRGRGKRSLPLTGARG